MTRVRIALIAIGVAAALVVVGFFLRGVSERSIKTRMSEELKTILKADVNALLIWLDDRKENASYFAAEETIAGATTRLGASSQAGASAVALRASTAARALDAMLDPVVAAFGYTDYFVLDSGGRIVASSNDSVVGDNPDPEAQRFVRRMLVGDTVVTLPIPVEGDGQNGGPEIIMFVGAPVMSGSTVAGVLAFGVAPERGFSEILRLARSGETGETYAFDSTGLMISDSRFDEDLKRIGLLPNEPDARSVRSIQIRDPGIDLTQHATGAAAQGGYSRNRPSGEGRFGIEQEAGQMLR